MKTFLIILLVAVVGAGGFAGGYYYKKSKDKTASSSASATSKTATTTPRATGTKTVVSSVVAGSSSTASTSTTASSTEGIKISSPTANQTITSPLTVSGEAVGSWFSEGELPIAIYDANGAKIADATATATGEWMTESYVPFSATIEFVEPMTPIGKVVIKKTDASGQGSGDKSVEISVKF